MAFKIADAYLDVEYRTGDAEAKLRKSLANQHATITVDADTKVADTRLTALQAKAKGQTTKVTVTAEITEATRKLEAVKAQAKEIKDAKVNVSADIADARAKLAALQVELRQLKGSGATETIRLEVQANVDRAKAELLDLQAQARSLGRATIQVDADASRATSELEAAHAAASQLDGKRVNVNVDADVGAALAKIALVSSALAGISVLAVAGVGAIAGAGAVAGVGIGSMIASLAGVGGAVKELGKAQTASGGAASKAASNHLQMAAAIDRVKQAQAALANTQASNASSLRRAEEAVANARVSAARQVAQAQQAVVAAQRNVQQANVSLATSEDRLRSAQQQELRAQQALTDARKAAQRQLEDYQTQMEDMVLSQEGASLAVRQAKLDLDKVMADPRNTQLARDEATLNYEQALQQQKDLGKQAERLAQDKADADKKGVDGSAQVISAQDQIIAAQKAVEDATRGVADAQHAVLDATTKVAEAQAAQSEAQLKSQQQIQDAVFAQADAQRQAAYSVAQAQQQVIDAQRAVQQASQSAGSAGGGGINKITEAYKGLSPEAIAFAKYLRGFIDGPLADLRKTGQSNLLPGLQKGLEDLEPILERQIIPAFGDFSKVLGQGIGDAIPIVGRLSGSLLNFATVSLRGLSPLEGILERFDARLSGVFTELEKSGDAGKAMESLSGILGELLLLLPPLIADGEKLLVAIGPGLTTVMHDLGGGILAVADAFVKFAPEINALLTAIAPLSPALLALGGAFFLFRRMTGGNDQVVKAIREGFKGMGADIDETSSKTSKFSTVMSSSLGRITAALAVSQIASAAFASTASVGVNTATKALESYAKTGDTSAEVTKRLVDDLATLYDTNWATGLAKGVMVATESLTGLGGVFDDSIQHSTERLASLDAGLASLVNNGNADQAAVAFGRLKDKADEQDISIERLKKQFPQYQDALDAISRKSGTATGATDRLNTAIKKASDTFFAGRDAESAYYAAVDRTTEALKTNGRTLDTHKEKGRANVQALDDQSKASAAYIQSLIDQGVPAAQVAKELDTQRAKLIESASKFQGGAAAAKAYADKVYAVPSKAVTDYKLNGITQATADLAALRGRLIDLQGVIAVSPLAGSYGQGLGVYKKARGGIIPGAPSTADDVPALLSRGEYVVNADATAKNRGALEAINSGRELSFQQSGEGLQKIAATLPSLAARQPVQTVQIPAQRSGGITIQSLTIQMPVTAALQNLTATERVRVARDLRDEIVKLEAGTR